MSDSCGTCALFELAGALTHGLCWVFGVVGALIVAKWVWVTVQWFRFSVLGPRNDENLRKALAPWLPRKGVWAVVTGGSDGIGKAFVYELAALGFNVAILSRTLAKMEAIAADIRRDHGVESRVLSVDFSSSDLDGTYAAVEQFLAPLDVTLLVNNVGGNEADMREVADTDVEASCRTLRLNNQSLLRMTHLVLPRMRERQLGLILNLSSMVGLMPSPYLSIYCGTKAFVDFFSRALSLECRPYGPLVRVASVCPATVVTPLSSKHATKETIFECSARTFARSAIACVDRGSNSFMPYWAHQVQAMAVHLLPTWLSERLALKVLGSMAAKERNTEDKKNA